MNQGLYQGFFLPPSLEGASDPVRENLNANSMFTSQRSKILLCIIQVYSLRAVTVFKIVPISCGHLYNFESIY